MIETDCKSLAERIAAKQANGLVDIKFYVNRSAGASAERVFEEADALFAATENAELVEDFKFDDRHSMVAA